MAIMCIRKYLTKLVKKTRRTKMVVYFIGATTPNTSPAFQKESFACPHCQIVARQTWKKLYRDTLQEFECATCHSCDYISIWVNKNMVYPLGGTAPAPDPDMPDKIKEIFEEARKISSISPRASLGLLRLCVEMLAEELGEKNGSLHTKIENLAKNFPRDVKEALEVTRITGNNALHGGQISIDDDDHNMAQLLFEIVNIIVHRMISEPKQIAKAAEKAPKR